MSESSTPPAVMSESGKHVSFAAPKTSTPGKASGPETTDATLETERRRLKLAPTFDRLIDANLQLVESVQRLVRVVYALLFVLLAMLAFLAFLAAAK